MLLVWGCTKEEVSPPCRSGSNNYRAEALSKRLTKNGVSHSLHPGYGVCYSPNNEQEIERALQQIDAYFYEVAGQLRNACEERAFTQWAQAEKLPYTIRDAPSFDGQTRSRLFQIYSLTEEDVAINRKKLLTSSARNACCSEADADIATSGKREQKTQGSTCPNPAPPLASQPAKE